jgi:hypothetical protein
VVGTTSYCPFFNGQQIDLWSAGQGSAYLSSLTHVPYYFLFAGDPAIDDNGDIVGTAGSYNSYGGVATATVGHRFSFVVHTSGFPGAVITESGALPRGLRFTYDRNGTATIAGTPTAGSTKHYTLTLKATNSVGAAKQVFILTRSTGAFPPSAFVADDGPLPALARMA